MKTRSEVNKELINLAKLACNQLMFGVHIKTNLREFYFWKIYRNTLIKNLQ